jgi:hypothetical protein
VHVVLRACMHVCMQAAVGEGAQPGQAELFFQVGGWLQSRSVNAAWTVYTEPSHSRARIAKPICRLVGPHLPFTPLACTPYGLDPVADGDR